MWGSLRLSYAVLAVCGLLVLLGLGLALRTLLRHLSKQWVLYVGTDVLTVIQGSRRTDLPWSDVGSVRIVDDRLVIFAPDGARQQSLAVDPYPQTLAAAEDIVRAVDTQLATRR